MYCWRNISMTVGTLMEIETCQIRGQVLLGSQFSVEKHRINFHGSGGDWQESKRPQGQTLYGQRCGNIWLMHGNEKRRKSGKSRNPNSTVPEDCVEITSLILMRSSSVLWRKLVESWKSRCQQQCVAGKLVAQLDNTKRNMLVLLRPTNLWGYAWKGLKTRTMKTSSQEEVWINWVTRIWCTNLFLCLKLWKYQMQRQQWRKNGKTGENPGMAADESQKFEVSDRRSKE